jgi:hypothetical protein
MAHNIELGYHAFVDDSDEEFGAVRNIAPDGSTISVFVENTGELSLPTSAILSVQAQKVIFDCAKLEPRVRQAIGHAHEAEVDGL